MTLPKLLIEYNLELKNVFCKLVKILFRIFDNKNDENGKKQDKISYFI